MSINNSKNKKYIFNLKGLGKVEINKFQFCFIEKENNYSNITEERNKELKKN